MSSSRRICGTSNARAGIVLAILAVATTSSALTPATATSPTPASASSRPAARPPLRVVLFYSPTCQRCEEAQAALAAAGRHWEGAIRVEQQNIEDMAAFNEMLAYEDHYSSDEQAPPKVFAGTQYLAGYDDISRRLNDVIARELASGSVTFVPPVAETQSHSVPPEILSRFEGLGIGAVALAGLLDGVNPCAFTTIVFLLSMLAYLGKTRRQLAIVGVGFTSAIFVTYLLLGLGILGAVKTFAVSRGLSAGLTYAVAALALVFACWSLIDFIRYVRSGDTKKLTLGLPKAVKARIHKVIRAGLSTRGLLAGSLAVGVVVALLESICTGQVYLPVIVFVARAPGLRTAAVGYLVFYNLMFILPLVVILVVAYLGVGSDRLGGFLHRHLAALKLALAVVFAALGVLLILTA